VNRQGYPIVLTADRTLMADYQLLFDGMLASSQTSTSPPALLSRLLMPQPKNGQIRARVAPLGLRRIEAALLEGGFAADDVIVVDERKLSEAIGPATRIVALTSGEPSGGGMNSNTMTGVAGGRIWPELMFRRALNQIRKAVAKSAPSARIVVGGPGAWQLAADPAAMREAGVDHVVTGYAEGNVAEVFRSIIQGEKQLGTICGKPVAAADIPRIRDAATMGVVEISRGCGLGCSFCTIAQTPMMHLPEDRIIADARTNVAAGRTSIAALSEDFFRYGAKGLAAEPEAAISLLTALRKIDGLRLIQIDHANVSSIAQFSDEQLRIVKNLLVGETGCEYPWVNVGIETASGELLNSNGGAAKMRGCEISEWGAFAAEQLRRLCRAGFLPMASLIMALHGETDDNARATLKWAEDFCDERITIFPMLYAPIDGNPGVQRRDLSRTHWEMTKACYKLNFKWIPRMYWDNQKAAGVSTAKRCLLQTMGKGQVLQWTALLALHAWRAKK
jgi:radical SAM superfamily enzyme YgiQ (UPF0313 family)